MKPPLPIEAHVRPTLEVVLTELPAPLPAFLQARVRLTASLVLRLVIHGA
jgi:hypothetical protein